VSRARRSADEGEIAMTNEIFARENLRYRLAGLCASAAYGPALPAAAPPAAQQTIRNLSAPGVAWAGFVAPKENNYTIARTFNDFTSPTTGIGPVTDDPAHPSSTMKWHAKWRPSRPIASPTSTTRQAKTSCRGSGCTQETETPSRCKARTASRASPMLGDRRARLPS